MTESVSPCEVALGPLLAIPLFPNDGSMSLDLQGLCGNDTESHESSRLWNSGIASSAAVAPKGARQIYRRL